MAVRKTVFTKSDAYQWKWEDGEGMIDFMPLEEYAEKLKRYFMLKRDNGILEARLHTDGGEFYWDTAAHKSIHKFFRWASEDHNNEVIIFGGSGKNFFSAIKGDSESDDPEQQHAVDHGESPDILWKLYEHSYYDGTNNIEAQIEVEQPTIGVWNGALFHNELPMLCDITIATEDAWFAEMHFQANMVPGDGVQICLRNLMGRKRFAYAELTGQVLTARQSLALGLINEIHEDTEACYKRAWEIAELIMLSGTRVTRRITTQILRAPWKMDIAWEMRHAFSTEMWCTATEESRHDSSLFRNCKLRADLARQGEKEGKVVRPRLGEIYLEDEIK